MLNSVGEWLTLSLLRTGPPCYVGWIKAIVVFPSNWSTAGHTHVGQSERTVQSYTTNQTTICTTMPHHTSPCQPVQPIACSHNHRSLGNKQLMWMLHTIWWTCHLTDVPRH